MSASNLSKAQARKKFEDVYAIIRKELLDRFVSESMPEDAVQWYARVSVPVWFPIKILSVQLIAPVM
jgi:hypothetical protein